MALRSIELDTRTNAIDGELHSLFDRFPWIYVAFRDHLFRDDTALALATLWAQRDPEPGTTLLELGCGPGFYARRIATRFPQVRAIGLDRSLQMVHRARARATTAGLTNCAFIHADALAIPRPADSVDAVISARLLMMLVTPAEAVAEIYRVLRPGGRCFISEPRSHLLALLPLVTLWTAATTASLLSSSDSSRGQSYLEPRIPSLMPDSSFRDVVASQPWEAVELWTHGRYQYAVCQKGTG